MLSPLPLTSPTSPVQALPSVGSAFLGVWSFPPDGPAKVALGAALVLLAFAAVPGGAEWLVERFDFGGATRTAHRRRFLVVGAFVAAFLSLGYIAFYLRGGPRSPEAAVTWLQGRALSHGALAWPTTDPGASHRAKNLLPSALAPGWLAGIVAPGYPALLAVTFLLGAPMLVGPLLAAGLVAATWFLGRECAAAAREDDARCETVGRIAAGLSIVCAALRYHTAEASPHGAAALATALALACALRGSRTGNTGLFAAAGLATGALLATAPHAAIAVGVGVLALGAGSPELDLAGTRAGAIGRTLAAIVPGAVLLLLANRAATGHIVGSAAAAYAAMYAEPLGSFRVPALALDLAQSLRSHLLDVANLEVLGLAPILAAPALRRRWRGARTAAVPTAGAIGVVAVVVVAEWVVAALTRPTGLDLSGAPGAGNMANVLPLEHALGALALAVAFGRRLERAATATFAIALAGFAVHASNDHERVAAAGLGRPRFEPDVAREGNVSQGLLFFEDDEGFELAHDPAVLASHGLAAARMRNDDHDRLLFDLLGHPPTHRYVGASTGSSVVPWSTGASDTWRFEAEADFPTEPPWGGFVEVIDASGSCASAGSVLAITPVGTAEAGVRLELPVPRGTTPPARRTWSVTPRVYLRRSGEAGGAGSADLALVTTAGEAPLAQWSWDDGPTPASGDGAARCVDLPSRSVDLGGDRTHAWLVLTARGGPAALDKTTLRGR